MASLSPMMQQYFDIKKNHKDQILFFRLGDFYEMFYDDAKLASRELELVLTGRDCGQENKAPMCGIPYHSSEAYIARLIKKGYKVAICEQVEDPKEAKGVVRREVIRVVTPGTLIESAMLEEGSNNYILSIYCADDAFGLSFADISTGRVHVTSVVRENIQGVKNEIAKFAPSEIVFSTTFLNYTEMGEFIKDRVGCCASVLAEEYFEEKECRHLINAQFGSNALEQHGLSQNPPVIKALGGLLSYLDQTQKVGIGRLVTLEVYGEERYMLLDFTARRNLELLCNMRTGERRGSLLWVLDRTKTAMGKRLLRRCVEQPLYNPIHIEKRLNAVDELVINSMLRMDVSELLIGIYDIERLLTRIVCGTSTPRELCSFRATLERLPSLCQCLSGVNSRLLQETLRQLEPLPDVAELIENCICDEPPAVLKDGWFIRPGFCAELDELRHLLTDNKDILASIEAKERENTGIKTLKIGFNKVFGYYIEITNSYKDMAPPEYIRKQTLSNCERYITQELKELEGQILTAKDRSIQIETDLLHSLTVEISKSTERIQATADAVAWVDLFCGFACLAEENGYCRPQITTNGDLLIEEGRHPVVEQLLGSSQRFVANDCKLDRQQNRIAILTGPNMAGKSTYIRQVAIIVLMAQIGCFVPAKTATIGVVDGIFTRVGASDDLATGQSTFMVEMTEVAQILRSATSESLLILDEVGRGTSTFDGMSIARAMLEYIADTKKLGAKTLFATHYHELTQLEKQLNCVKNYNTAVKKRGDDITFLRRIVPGAVDDSYGIEVSKLAGIPEWIIKRAHEVLEELERSRPIKMGEQQAMPVASVSQQMLLNAPSAAEDAIRALDPNTLTPLEALAKLYELKTMV